MKDPVFLLNDVLPLGGRELPAAQWLALAEPRLYEATYPGDFNLSEFIESLLAWHPKPPEVAREIQRDLTS